MTAATRDRWAEWLLERRFGGDPDVLEATLRHAFTEFFRVPRPSGRLLMFERSRAAVARK